METDTMRIGHGFDVHPFSDDSDRVLVLGGVSFEGHRGLIGHSDADVIAHACTDALLGACGLGDIGEMFPDTDAKLLGADSIVMLRRAVERMAAEGWEAVNVDCTMVADEPKIAHSRPRMQAILGEAVGAPVTIKGKSTEGMAGLSGGIQCFAVALVRAT